VTLGIAGFGALASLTPYRPVFMMIAVVALAASYAMTYRPRWRQLRASGLRAYRPQLHEVVLWVVTLVVGVLALFPVYNAWLA
jgi:hypothetical protein